MTSLHELQSAFIGGVLHDRPQRACTMIGANGLAPERRLAIYRNNARENFTNTLEAGFPVLARLGGVDWFRQTAHAYMRAQPSRSGNLHYIGERFATFLREQLAGSPFEYFGDVAALEWAYQEVLVAADHPSLDVTALQRVAPEEYEALRFSVHPALRLVSSPYPVLAIWRANQPTANAEGPSRAMSTETALHLDAGASRVLVIRRDDHVELRELSSAEYVLLEAFANGSTFGEATEALLAAAPAADLATTLARLIRLGVLVDFNSSDAPTGAETAAPSPVAPAEARATTAAPSAVAPAKAGAHLVPDGSPPPRE